jgi:hypothetical protein
MAEPKTVQTHAAVGDFLSTVAEPRRADALALCDLMTKATGAQPVMWGSAIVGFGTYHYVYVSGREGDWPPVGFSPRKANLTVYLADGVDKHADLLARLGPHTTGKGCLYVKRLADVDTAVLAQLVAAVHQALDGTILRA